MTVQVPFWRIKQVALRLLTLTTFLLFAVTSVRPQEKRPKISTSVLCGFVTDFSGTPIQKATVSAMWADFGTSQTVDAQGSWTFGKDQGPHWMMIQADGYETFIFDYVDKEDPKNTGADKPMFTLAPKDRTCPVPIYVRLASKGLAGGFVSLDPNQKETKAH